MADNLQDMYLSQSAQVGQNSTGGLMSSMLMKNNPTVDTSNVLDKGVMNKGTSGVKDLMQNIQNVRNAQSANVEPPKSPIDSGQLGTQMSDFWKNLNKGLKGVDWNTFEGKATGLHLLGTYERALTGFTGQEAGFRAGVYGHQVGEETKNLMSQYRLLEGTSKVEQMGAYQQGRQKTLEDIEGEKVRHDKSIEQNKSFLSGEKSTEHSDKITEEYRKAVADAEKIKDSDGRERARKIAEQAYVAKGGKLQGGGGASIIQQLLKAGQ